MLTVMEADAPSHAALPGAGIRLDDPEWLARIPPPEEGEWLPLVFSTEPELIERVTEQNPDDWAVVEVDKGSGISAAVRLRFPRGCHDRS